MFPYRVKYTESESDIQNSNVFYKNTQNTKIFQNFWIFEYRTISNFYFVSCINCITHILICFRNLYLYTISRQHNSGELFPLGPALLNSQQHAKRTLPYMYIYTTFQIIYIHIFLYLYICMLIYLENAFRLFNLLYLSQS